MVEFTSEAVARQAVKHELLSVPGVSQELVEAILAKETFLTSRGGPGWGSDTRRGPLDTELVFKDSFRSSDNTKYYAIRNDDLELSKEVVSVSVEIAKIIATPAGAAAGAAAAGAAAAGSISLAWVIPPAIVIAATTSLVSLALRLRKKSAELTKDEYTVLAALKQRGPQTETDLGFILNGLRFSGPDHWTPTRISDTLNALLSKVLKDGTTESLVSKDSTGRWNAAGV